MEGHAADITGIATVAVIAAMMGIAFLRLGQPPSVGYIIAGVVLGPTGFALIENADAVALLAELGVILLLFLVGMEISIRAFLMVIKPAGLVALGQIAIAMLVSFGFGVVLGWSTAQSVLLGFIVALSSTAVAMTMLEEIGELRRETGRITVGVLVAQDIAVVPMLIIVGVLGALESEAAQGPNLLNVVLKVIIALLALASLFRLLGKGGKFRMPLLDSLRGRTDLVAIAMLALCFAFAGVSSLLGLSPAYGAFVAGLIVAGSTMRAEAIQVTHPIQSILVIIFFVSIGLLIDLDYIMANAGVVFLFVVGVILAKTIFNIALLRFVGQPWEIALPSGLIMAQIGEFSFVLAAAGLTVGAVDSDGHRLAVSVIALTLLVSPLWMSIVRNFHSVAREGITDFRQALSDTYQGEVETFERGATVVRWRWRQMRRMARRGREASRQAWRLHQKRRHRKRVKATEMADMPPIATADAYPVDEATASGRSEKTS